MITGSPSVCVGYASNDKILPGFKAVPIKTMMFFKRQALLPVVKVDRRELIGDPYVAFRRRMDRVQTRKNRKNDEISYEKMLRLRKDFHRAL